MRYVRRNCGYTDRRHTGAGRRPMQWWSSKAWLLRWPSCRNEWRLLWRPRSRKCWPVLTIGPIKKVCLELAPLIVDGELLLSRCEWTVKAGDHALTPFSFELLKRIAAAFRGQLSHVQECGRILMLFCDHGSGRGSNGRPLLVPSIDLAPYFTPPPSQVIARLGLPPTEERGGLRRLALPSIDNASDADAVP